MREGAVIAAPVRIVGDIARGTIVRVVNRSGDAVPEVWEDGKWVPATSALLAETLPGRAIDLSPEALDKLGIPREDAEEEVE